MSLISLETTTPVPKASAALVDRQRLYHALRQRVEGEVRFDKFSRALYSTDASVYQIEPLGVLIPRSQQDIIEAVRLCHEFRCPITLRGGGTSQAGQAVGEGLQIDTSKYVNRLLEVNARERWARVEPGMVLDELNTQLKHYGLRFAPDITTASRATIGGMIANNSCGARSILYGKTIDHVLALKVALSDGSLAELEELDSSSLERQCAGDSLEAQCYRTVRRLALEHAAEIKRRYPKILRRVSGYNLDEFVDPARPFHLGKLIVGSEGTLAVVLEAKLRLVPLPKHKAVLTAEFPGILDALSATPKILSHHPSAVEVMDKFILDHTRQNPALDRVKKSFLRGDPGGLLCIEFYDDRKENLLPRLQALEADLKGLATHCHYALDLAEQQQIWGVREAALGLSTAMKGDAKSVSFVEDTAVAPERLRDFIERFLAIIHKHGTVAGIYAHASVGCLHVRPVVNLKTEAGVRQFESIAAEVADLVLEFGGALSGEHGDGLVRSPFLRKMFGATIYEAFRTIKRTFDPQGILNPGKIVDAPPLTTNLRFGPSYQTPNPATEFDYSEFGGLGGAVEMCSGVGACRKRLEGTMCPSFMVTREEMHSTRGRANVLRLAMIGQLGQGDLAQEGVKQALDLCLECRACKSECPVGVDMARFKSEFLAAYWRDHRTPLRAYVLGRIPLISRSAAPFAPLINRLSRTAAGRWLTEKTLGFDARRMPPPWARLPLERIVKQPADPEIYLFRDTFTNFYHPEIGVSALTLFAALGLNAGLAPNACCARPLISQGFLREARQRAIENTKQLHPLASRGHAIVFCEPSCLSSVKEDLPDLLRGEDRRKALEVAQACWGLEEFLESRYGDQLALRAGPKRILLHGHCHQKSMGLLRWTKSLLQRVPGAEVVDLDAGCCGMAGSFGYLKEHYEVSVAIAERKLLPAVRALKDGEVVVAPGFSCRHQILDLAHYQALHPASLLHQLLQSA
ncbi:MAG: FAD-binding protein [Bryobacteraceae bacterium]|nr:FAD-binding protein [Bryobacteraceae bacterium]MDW8378666.1 FAD-linked oxidase C-terminal domain-containing protein [Bryobacterales bacterium]